jgi:hypothetical protein
MARYPAVAATFLAAAFANAIVSAAVIPVPAGTSIQDAIDAAAPGDTLVLEFGTYPGAVVVNKSLRILGRGIAIIDPLGAAVALEVTADNVTIAVRPNHVGDALAIGAPGSCPTDAIIRVSGVTGLRMRDVHDRDACAGLTAIGLDITNVTNSQFRGIGVRGQEVGIRVRQIAERAGVKLIACGGQSNTIGGLFEDIAPGAARRGLGLRVKSSFITPAVYGEPYATALRLVNADRSIFAHAFLTGDVELDAASDNNIIRNGILAYDGVVTDAGTGNCFLGNEGIPNSCP